MSLLGGIEVPDNPCGNCLAVFGRCVLPLTFVCLDPKQRSFPLMHYPGCCCSCYAAALTTHCMTALFQQSLHNPSLSDTHCLAPFF
jgi:hypothetical protein